jgi:hypothetical protein
MTQPKVSSEAKGAVALLVEGDIISCSRIFHLVAIPQTLPPPILAS